MNHLNIEQLSLKAAIVCAIDISISGGIAIYVYRGALDSWYWCAYGQHVKNKGDYPHYQFCVDFAGGIATPREEWSRIIEIPLFSIGEGIEVFTEEDGWHDGTILDIFIFRPALHDADREYRTDWAGVVKRNYIRQKTPHKAIARP